MNELLKLGGEWGWAAVILVWLVVNGIPKLSNVTERIVGRRWAKENHKQQKIGELYERLLDDQRAIFNTLNKNTSALERNSNAVEQMSLAIETEFPLVLQAVRDTLGRVSRLEEIVQRLESVIIEVAQEG